MAFMFKMDLHVIAPLMVRNENDRACLHDFVMGAQVCQRAVESSAASI